MIFGITGKVTLNPPRRVHTGRRLEPGLKAGIPGILRRSTRSC
jgi:hypothetical protein